MRSPRNLSITLVVLFTTMVAAFTTIPSIPSVHAAPPNTISWAEKNPIPYRTAQAGVIGGADGRIYVMGGYSNTSPSTPNSTARAYDPRTDSWSSLANLPTPSRGPGIAIDNSGLIYVMSGFSGAGDIANNQIYNVTTNTWSAGTNIPTPIWMPGATTGNDGRIYLAGGESGASATTILQIYNPQTKAWSTGTSMSTGRKQFQLVAAPNGLLYAIGGMSGSNVPTAAVEAYNITGNSWSPKASVPTSVAVFGAALGRDGLIYVFGGSNVYTNNTPPFYGTVYSYDPRTDTWYTNVQSLPTPRRELSAATSSFNNRMYVLGGADGTFLTTNEEATVSTGASTSTTVTCNLSSVIVNNPTSCNVIVTDTSGAPTTPTGSVTFTTSATGNFTGTCTLTGSGASSTCATAETYTPFATGTHIISATYNGDLSHDYSTSTGFTLTVTTVPVRSTSMTVTCTPTSVAASAGSTTTCTVVVTDTSSGPVVTPTGLIGLSSTGSGTILGTCSLTGTNATATCTVTYKPSGTSSRTDTITADYSGDTGHSGSSSTSQVTVNASTAGALGGTMLGLPTLDWIILAIALGVVFLAILLGTKKRKNKQFITSSNIGTPAPIAGPGPIGPSPQP